MNYLAHARGLLDDPYLVAGAATPDWLCLTRPRLRCRSKHALPFADSSDRRLASFARGVLRHHADDDWFHQTQAFNELTLELARRIRRLTRDEDGMRPSFVGHILVELLLDATLIAEDARAADRYYAALNQIDPEEIAGLIGELTGEDASQTAAIVRRFLEIRFLDDYPDDARLLVRLNQVMRRVRLPELPQGMLDILPQARRDVTALREQLLTPPFELPRRHGLLAAPASW
jgi:hypothetical protein